MFSGELNHSVSLSRKFFWDLERGGHGGLCVECVSRYWERTLMNGDGIIESC